MIDSYFENNMRNIRMMAIKCSQRNNNTLFVDDLVSECYLFVKKSKRIKERSDIAKAVSFFFNSQYYRDSVTKEMKGLPTVELQDFKTADPPQEVPGICIMEVKESLPPAYRQLFEIMFEQKKFRLREIQEELGTSKYGADQLRKNLYKHLGIEKPDFRKLDKNVLNL